MLLSSCVEIIRHLELLCTEPESFVSITMILKRTSATRIRDMLHYVGLLLNPEEPEEITGDKTKFIRSFPSNYSAFIMI